MIILILPAHNEEDNIGFVLEDAHSYLTKANLEHIFVVVDDGSTDRTKQVVLSHSNFMPIHIVEHDIKKGIKFAFMSGFWKACQLSKNEDDIIIMLEADNTLDLSIISKMVDKIKKGYNVVSASRFMRGGRYVEFPFKRLILSFACNMALRFLFHIKGLSDYTIFFRAYKACLIKDAIRSYSHRLIECKGFAGNAELLIKLNRISFLRIADVPLVYRYDNKMGRSKMNIYETIKEYLLMFLRLYFYSRGFKRYSAKNGCS